MNKSLLRILSILLVFAIAMPASAAVTDEDIARAQDEIDRIISEADELSQDVIEAYGRQAALESEIERLDSSIDFAQGQMADTEDRIADLAVELYMGSTSGSSLSMLFSATDQEYPAGLQYLQDVSGVDAGAVDQMRTLRDELDRQTVRRGEALDEQVALAAELEAMAEDLQVELGEAQEIYDDLVAQQIREEEERRRREEEERRRREAAAAAAAAADSGQSSSSSGGSGGSSRPSPAPAPPPVPEGTGVCPVAGAVSFRDSWGSPRSGGRRHKGVDMIAARGVPIVAIYSGRIRRTSNSALGGKSIYFYSDAGDMYYYAHLDAFGDIRAGQSVPAGYVLGYNGSSGNAPDYLPHLHFEYHPGGGAAVNPYPLVRKLC